MWPEKRKNREKTALCFHSFVPNRRFAMLKSLKNQTCFNICFRYIRSITLNLDIGKIQWVEEKGELKLNGICQIEEELKNIKKTTDVRWEKRRDNQGNSSYLSLRFGSSPLRSIDTPSWIQSDLYISDGSSWIQSNLYIFDGSQKVFIACSKIFIITWFLFIKSAFICRFSLIHWINTF